MSDYPCIYTLPSGNHNVRPSLGKHNYNLGTYTTMPEAQTVLRDFLINAPSTMRQFGPVAVEELAAEARMQAKSKRLRQPKAQNRREKDRLSDMQTKIDQLSMQVDILKNRVERLSTERASA